MVELINAGTEDKPIMVDPRGHPKGTKHVLTKPGSHVAKAQGYAAGRIINPGEPVPHGIPFAEEWMVKAKDADDEGVEVLGDPARNTEPEEEDDHPATEPDTPVGRARARRVPNIVE